jgi:NO-binding membrane sensor protein with MHYT domain
MVIAIAYDIKIFLLILFVALVGFAQGFWLLSVRCVPLKSCLRAGSVNVQLWCG